jgi:hypothetical protein
MKSFIAVAVALVLSSCAISTEAPVSEEAASRETSKSQSIEPLARVWRQVGQEFCPDLCPFTGCNATCPTPKCPSGTIAGRPCSYPSGSTCWRSATEFECVEAGLPAAEHERSKLQAN